MGVSLSEHFFGVSLWRFGWHSSRTEVTVWGEHHNLHLLEPKIKVLRTWFKEGEVIPGILKDLTGIRAPSQPTLPSFRAASHLAGNVGIFTGVFPSRPRPVQRFEWPGKQEGFSNSLAEDHVNLFGCALC